MNNDESPLFCARCLVTLIPGRGDFFVVQIDAVADPNPPVFTEEDLARAGGDRYDDLVAQLADCSEQEAMDQVHRRTVIHLCMRCFRSWIEDPVG